MSIKAHDGTADEQRADDLESQSTAFSLTMLRSELCHSWSVLRYTDVRTIDALCAQSEHDGVVGVLLVEQRDLLEGGHRGARALGRKISTLEDCCRGWLRLNASARDGRFYSLVRGKREECCAAKGALAVSVRQESLRSENLLSPEYWAGLIQQDRRLKDGPYKAQTPAGNTAWTGQPSAVHLLEIGDGGAEERRTQAYSVHN